MKIHQAPLVRASAGVLLAAAMCLPLAAAPRPDLDYGKVPLVFEENHGQAERGVRYISRGGGNALLLRDTDAVLALGAGRASQTDMLRFRWSGARTVRIQPEQKQQGSSNYLIGADRSQWKTGIPQYAQVRYRGLYDGIDLVYYGRQGQLEYDLIVAAGADPAQARFSIEGTRGLHLDGYGDLVLSTSAGEVRHRRPIAYQLIDGKRVPVDASYTLAKGNEVAFRVGQYNPREPLIIDPVLVYSTFFGGTNIEQAEAVAVDGNGNAYITGQTVSTNLPVASAYQGANGGGAADAFVMKLNAAGTQIVYSTYLGGSGTDAAHGIAVDGTGAAYITGETNSTNFPTVAGWRTTRNGLLDGFVAKLAPAGNALVIGTYIGGSGSDNGQAITVNSANEAYVTGYTNSTDLHNLITGQSFNGDWDAFLIKITAAGFAWSTYAGGTGNDRAYATAVYNADGSVYIAGGTTSTNLAGTAVQPANGGTTDAFVAKFSSTGTRVYWAYRGGADIDTAHGVAVDTNGNVYIAGETHSTNFPVVAGAQMANGGDWDAFLAKMNPLGTAVVYSTYLGGTLEDRGFAVAVDPGGNAYVAGQTISANFPVLESVKTTPPSGAYDAFVTKFNPAGNARVYSSLFGGTANDVGLGLAVDAAGAAYLTGRTLSANMPVTLTGSSLKGQDAFLAKLGTGGGACTFALTPGTLVVHAGGGIRFLSIETGAGCAWTATSQSPFVTFSGPASGTGPGWVAASLEPNPGVARTGAITVAGQQVNVSQSGSVVAGCVYDLSSQAVNMTAAGGAGTFAIAPAVPACGWGAYSSTSWAQIFPLTGTGTTTLNYTVFPNFSTFARTATITAGGRTFTISQAANTLTSNQRFVQLLYFNYFGRLPSQAEIDLQVNQALNLGVPRGELATTFLNSTEFNIGGRFVAGLYVGLLNRDAEYGGWLFQRNALASALVTQDSLVQNFLNSAEYVGKFGNPSNAEFVRLLYRYILLREPSQPEVDFQASQLTTGTTRVQLARNFLNSQEFKIGTGPRLTSFLLYATLLLRDPNPGEFAERVAQLSGSTPVPVRTLVDQIVASAEFTQLLQ